LETPTIFFKKLLPPYPAVWLQIMARCNDTAVLESQPVSLTLKWLIIKLHKHAA